jgi:feruloyl esterase
MVDAVNPDLGPFSARGGKLILYHGWNDPAIPALSTIDYALSVQAKMGKQKAAEFLRLFLVPGMQHCSGGPGPSAFGQDGMADNASDDTPEHNIYRALESWVEAGKAPEEVVARHFETNNGKPSVIFTRPLCAWPKAAAYTGSGDPKAASSYACVEAR